MSRDTVGKLSSDLIISDTGGVNPIDQQRENQREYIKELLACIASGKKTLDSSFYIVVITKKERLMQNVIRNYFFPTLACPTPDWDQTVYYYDKTNERLEYYWTVPDKNTCQYMRGKAYSLPKDQWELLDYVLKFEDGSLLKLAKRLNKEEKDSALLSK